MVNDHASMCTNLAVHSTGNFPEHSLGQPRLDCTLAIIALCIIWDYVSQGNAWSSTSGTCQRKQHATLNVFTSYTCELLYIFLDFQVPEMLYRGPEFL